MKPTLYGADKPLRNTRMSLSSVWEQQVDFSSRNEHVVEPERR